MPQLDSLTKLDVADLLLMLAGAIVLAAEIAWQWRGPRRDPLRGSLLRANALSAGWVWLALLTYIVSGLIGSGVAALYTPAGSHDDVALWRSILAGNLGELIVIVTMIWIASRTFLGGLRGFGIGRQPFARDLTAAIAVLLVGFCLCGVIVWTTEPILHWLAPKFQMPVHAVFTTLAMPDTPRFVKLNALIGAALLAPVGEELLFRGILQSGFHKVFPARSHSLYHRWAAIGCVATLFGLMHLATPQHVPALIVLGLLLGYLYERTGSILAPIYLHVLFNCKSLLWHYLGG